MEQLAQYGGRMLTIDGHAVVELVNPNDNARARHQYRRTPDGDLEHRVLMSDGEPDADGSPWVRRSPHDLARLRSVRGEYSPILDPLGL